MSHNSNTVVRNTVVRNTLLTLIAILSALSSLSAQATWDCSQEPAPQSLLPRDVHRSVGGLVGESHCFRLDLPSPGILHLDLAVAGWAASRARFELFAADGVRFETLERSPAEHLVWIEAGTWFLEIVGEDPQRELPPYRLSSRFITLTKSETDGELDLDPETVRFPAGFGGGSLGDILHSETDGELDLDPETQRFPVDPGCAGRFHSETDGELDLDPETLRVGCDKPRAPSKRLCDDVDESGDDHGDTFFCASKLRHSRTGELVNGWGDDADVFHFDVDHWQTLEIATEGDLDTHGTLFNSAGQGLAFDDDDGSGNNFRFVRTLAPGTYFVRVEGGVESGAYRVIVRQL